MQWIRRFIPFHHKRRPLEMGEIEVRDFHSFLAREQQVAAAAFKARSIGGSIAKTGRRY